MTLIASLFALAALLFMAALWHVWSLLRRTFRPALALHLTLLFAAATLYASALLPGVIGLLTGQAVALSLSILSGLSRLLVRRAARAAPPRLPSPDVEGVPWNGGLVLVAAGSVFGLWPILHYVAQLLFGFSALAFCFEIDTVSIHLPATVEFLQQHSLWYLGGAYSSYSFCYELIGLLPLACFHATWGLVHAHTFGLLLMLVTIYVVAENLVRVRPSQRPIHPLFVFLPAAALWCSIYENEVFRVGKNDIFLAATTWSAFALLLESLHSPTDERGPARSRLLLLAAAVAAGLALGTKPHGAIFLAFFIPMAAFGPWSEIPALPARWRKALARGAGVAVVAALIGGFFLLRNVLMLHGVISTERANGLERMPIVRLMNPDFRVWNAGTLLLAAGLASTAIPLGYALARRRAAGPARPFGWLIGFHILTIVAFLTAPFMIPEPRIWFIRLGMTMGVGLAAWTGLLVAELLSSLGSTRRYDTTWLRQARNRAAGHPRLSTFLAAIFGLTAVFLPAIYYAHRRAAGLPGFEAFKGLPPTGIYREIQLLQKPTRIYAAGLRPWVLFGREFQHRVFYDLHSDVLYAEPAGQRRLMAVLQAFHPDLLLLSVDPHPDSGPPRKPLAAWLSAQPCFKEIYSDDSVSAYRVRSGWERLLARYPPEPGPLRMGG